jgi:hypothetical protein
MYVANGSPEMTVALSSSKPQQAEETLRRIHVPDADRHMVEMRDHGILPSNFATGSPYA